MAPVAAFIFEADRCAIGALKLDLGTVWILSKLAAQVSGRPSWAVSTTSVGILRMVEVIGAMVTLFSTAIAESRVRMSTGRRLLGAGNVYQHTSPRCITRPSPARESSCRIRPQWPVD